MTKQYTLSLTARELAEIDRCLRADSHDTKLIAKIGEFMLTTGAWDDLDPSNHADRDWDMPDCMF